MRFPCDFWFWNSFTEARSSYDFNEEWLVISQKAFQSAQHLPSFLRENEIAILFVARKPITPNDANVPILKTAPVYDLNRFLRSYSFAEKSNGERRSFKRATEGRYPWFSLGYSYNIYMVVCISTKPRLRIGYDTKVISKWRTRNPILLAIISSNWTTGTPVITSRF